jgi:tRNA A37 threonylcarbamoyltransferase TsaD
MKSQVSGLLKELQKKGSRNAEHGSSDGFLLSDELVCEIAYEFQEAVVEVLVKKLIRA